MVKNMLNKITMELKNRGYNAEITTVVKNGVEKKGITIGDGNIKPTIYPDLTKTLDECVDEIINTYENTPENFYDVSKITSWEYVKDNLMICLQKKSNEDILKRDFLDLEMYVRVDVSNGGTYKVKPNMFKDVSDDEVIARALFNTEKNTTINNMAKVIAEMMGCDIIDEFPGDNNSFVVTNKAKSYGAGVICNKKMLRAVANEYASNLIIIPSSIHECLLFRSVGDEPDMDAFTTMVREVNENAVIPEEVLSDHAYFYNKEADKITFESVQRLER